MLLLSKIPNSKYAGSGLYSTKYLEVCTLGRTFCCGEGSLGKVRQGKGQKESLEGIGAPAEGELLKADL